MAQQLGQRGLDVAALGGQGDRAAIVRDCGIDVLEGANGNTYDDVDIRGGSRGFYLSCSNFNRAAAAMRSRRCSCRR